MPYVKVNDVEMFYETSGEGEPLLLIHGAFGTGSTHWRPQIPLFSQHFNVVNMDLRGHGKTGNPAGQLSLEMFANDIVEFIAALGLGRVHIFGFSLGGIVALTTAIKQPTAVRSLVLWGVAYRPDDRFLNRINREHDLLENSRLTTGLRRIHSQVYGEGQFDDLSRLLRAEALQRKAFTAEELDVVKCPTLICQGDRDEFVSLEQAFELRRMLANSRLLVLPGRGHMNLGTVECFNQLVLDFLLMQVDKSST